MVGSVCKSYVWYTVVSRIYRESSYNLNIKALKHIYDIVRKQHTTWKKTLKSFRKWSYLYLLAVLGLRCCSGFSLVTDGGSYSSLWCAAAHFAHSHCCGTHSLPWLLFCGARALGLVGVSSCSSPGLEHRLSSCGVQALCSTACGIFLDRDQTHVTCIGKQILWPQSHLGSLKMLKNLISTNKIIFRIYK